MGKRLYYTYNKIRKYAYFVAISAISGTITGACIQNNGIMATEFMVFMSSMIADIIAKSKISNIGQERFKIINARNYTLDKLVEYSSKYDLKSVVEHKAFFDFALFNGYLSHDKTYSFPSLDLDYTIEIYIGDAMILNNHGVCRHIAPYCRDFFDRKGFPTELVIGYSSYPEDDEADLDDSIKNDIKRKVNYILEQIFDIRPIKQLEKDLGNHEIIKVNDDNHSYYLNSTASNMYWSGENILNGDNENSFRIYPYQTVRINRAYGLYTIIDLPTIDIDQYDREYETAYVNIESNKELMEEFYKEVHETLGEAESEYQRIMKKYFK